MRTKLLLIAVLFASSTFASENKATKRVRCQIREDLALTDIILESDLEKPVVCIGTGRKLAAMRLKHVRTVIVEDEDVCIDLERRIEPDYVHNGWEVSRLVRPLPASHFAAVFFSHVGSLGIPLLDEFLIPTIQSYLTMLLPGGALVFNSEVYLCERAIQILAEHHACEDFESLKTKWSSLFLGCGFCDVKILIKNEEKSYFKGCFSILLVAKKAVV